MSFSCRLPVLIAPQVGEGDYQGAFITFPAATMATDPSGAFTPVITSNLLKTVQTPVLVGGSGLGAGLPFYDAAEHRWLPVSSGQASPDRSHYAYLDQSIHGSSTLLQVHVVSVMSATDRTFSFPPATPGAIWTQVADFDGAAVYLVYGNGQDYSYYGLWRLDVATARVTSIAHISYVELVKGGIAWVGLNDPRDPSPPGGGQSFDTLISVNLATGTRTLWDYVPRHTVSVRSVDGSGRPTVRVSDPDGGNGAIERLVAPGTTDFIHEDLDHWFVQPDGNRLWLGNDHGVYLYTPEAGLQKVFVFAAKTGDVPESLEPAGFCR